MSDPLDGSIRRLHPLTPVLDVVRALPSILFGVAVWSRGTPGVAAAALGAVGLGGYLGWRYLAWWRFTYRFDEREVVVESGVLQRTRRVVPLARVQQVDVQRRLRHQVAGLAIIRIDTAGTGDEAEVVLDAVSDAEAGRIRARVGAVAAGAPGRGLPPAPTAAEAPEGARGDDRAHDEPPVPSAAAEPDVPVLGIGVGRLALAGITGSKLAVVVAVLGAGLGLYDDLLGVGRSGGVPTEPPWEEVGAPAPIVVALVVVLAVPIWLAVAAGAQVLADGGYRMTRRRDVLHVRRGVLDQREASLAVHRVQAVRIHQNALRRVLGLVSVTIQSAGGSSGAEVDGLLRHVLPGAPTLPRLHPAPPAARRRAWLRRAVPALVLGAAGAWLGRAVGPAVLVLPAAAVGVAALAGELAYRGLGWADGGGHVVARRGGLARETIVVPVAKVQSTRLVSTPLQRRAGLATLLLDVAGRGATPAIVDAEGLPMTELRHGALTSTAARRDEVDVRRRTAAAR